MQNDSAVSKKKQRYWTSACKFYNMLFLIVLKFLKVIRTSINITQVKKVVIHNITQK